MASSSKVKQLQALRKEAIDKIMERRVASESELTYIIEDLSYSRTKLIQLLEGHGVAIVSDEMLRDFYAIKDEPEEELSSGKLNGEEINKMMVKIKNGKTASLLLKENEEANELDEEQIAKLQSKIDEANVCREKLVIAYRKSVMEIVKQYISIFNFSVSKSHLFEFEDLMNIGLYGVIKAIDKYSSEFGVRFGYSFLKIYVIKELQNQLFALRDKELALPMSMVRQQSKLLSFEEQYKREYGKEPSIEETIEALYPNNNSKFRKKVMETIYILKNNPKVIRQSEIEKQVRKTEDDDEVFEFCDTITNPDKYYLLEERKEILLGIKKNLNLKKNEFRCLLTMLNLLPKNDKESFVVKKELKKKLNNPDIHDKIVRLCAIKEELSNYGQPIL